MPFREMRRRVAVLALCFATLTGHAQELTGTLKKAWDTGAVTIGYRASSIPFSYLSARGEPVGYALDICRALVTAMEQQLGRGLALHWQPVTADSRIQAVASGLVDLECGSTTHNTEREKLVSFSPTTFVSGTKLMVRKGSVLRTFRDLAGKRVVVTAGTTNEKTMRSLADKFKLNMQLVVARDHTESFDALKAGTVDAFATDDVLLFGLLAQNNARTDFAVVGEFLSYDPYGIMFRKDDASLAKLVDESFRRLAEEGDLDRLYKQWFLRPLPSGPGINLPMSPQLGAIFQSLVSKPE
jgi:ABC-type amino acid transport substrate-binding protein